MTIIDNEVLILGLSVIDVRSRMTNQSVEQSKCTEITQRANPFSISRQAAHCGRPQGPVNLSKHHQTKW